MIDVSGDGRCQNYDYYEDDDNDYNEDYGIEWNEAIARLSGRVDVVNGICITTSQNVIGFYRDILIQGDNSFYIAGRLLQRLRRRDPGEAAPRDQPPARDLRLSPPHPHPHADSPAGMPG